MSGVADGVAARRCAMFHSTAEELDAWCTGSRINPHARQAAGVCGSCGSSSPPYATHARQSPPIASALHRCSGGAQTDASHARRTPPQRTYVLVALPRRRSVGAGCAHTGHGGRLREWVSRASSRQLMVSHSTDGPALQSARSRALADSSAPMEECVESGAHVMGVRYQTDRMGDAPTAARWLHRRQ